jgi:twitching motility protein PilT
MSEPTITVQGLLDVLGEYGVVTSDRLGVILGPNRLNPTLNQLEVALERSATLSRSLLLQLIRAASGTDTLDGPAPQLDPSALPQAVSRATGSLVISTDPLTVAMVEDLPEHLTTIAATLGTADFHVVLVTALQYDELRATAYVTGVHDVRPEIESLYTALDEAIAGGASDVHLKVGMAPTLRVDGETRALEFRPLDAVWLTEQIRQVAGDAALTQIRDDYDYDFAFDYGQFRFRFNLGMDRNGPTVAARKLATTIPTPDELNLPKPVRDFVNLDVGIVLVVGATGSGKSTTLASLLAEICRNQHRHVITLEQPVEFILPRGKAIISQRELGSSFTSFAAGLRQALRQDPDVILVGELRDLDTMRAAFNAAETGHLVFATVHAYDTVSTLGRIVNAFPAEEQDQVRSQLSYVLKGVVAQKLLPLAHSRGRVAAHEVLLGTPAVASNLRKVDGITAIRQTLETGVKFGMQTLDMSIANLVSQGTVSVDVAERRASDPDALRRLVESLGGAGGAA